MKNNFRFIKISFFILVFAFVACHKKADKEDHSNHKMEGQTKQETMYTCPMPEDSVFSDKPGNCPKCGMELIKVESEKNKSSYSCPMHPEVISDKPGTCPKCGMNLELTKKEDIDTLAQLIKPTNNFIVSNLKAIAPSVNKSAKRISAEGYLTYDPNKANSISARVSGRIERLYVKYNFQKVSKGDKLLDIYSPDLLTAQNEYLYIIRSKDTSDRIARNALQSKLRNLGMSEGAIAQIQKSGKANPYVSIYATANGHVHFLKGNTNIASHAFGLKEPASSGMDGNNAMEGEENQVLREGDYVKTGDVLFTIADQSSIWALFKVLPSDINAIKKGQAVEVSINDETHEGEVNFIEKSFEDFYTVRVYLECNDHSKLKIGTLVKGYISVKQTNKESIWVPSKSVLSLGKSKSAVFVKRALGYEAKSISTGVQGSEWIEVTSGLTLKDSIAPVASYLVDSEAFIETK